jgi:glyoxylase-like metal-dependent hydrolase (beta-lactamase superfamily II)
VWVTNRRHSRAAAVCRERYGVAMWAHQADADRLEARADRTVAGGETLPGEIEVIHVPGKSPGEIAFYLPRARSAARLLDYDFDALLLCDGEPLPTGAKQKWGKASASSTICSTEPSACARGV